MDKQVQSGYSERPPKPVFKRMIAYLVGMIIGESKKTPKWERFDPDTNTVPAAAGNWHQEHKKEKSLS